MRGRPGPDEASPYYFTYIDQVSGDDIVSLLDDQLSALMTRLETVSEDKSLYRYAPGKWSMREVLGHINDCERLFTLRAFWFARGFDAPLPSFDQNVAVQASGADQIPWQRHLDEFSAARVATFTFLANLPEEAWMRSGIASDNRFTVRALAYVIAGHVEHHWKILEEKYLREAK
jgi:uncharacterized damage-inducible protein DinB